MKGGKVFSLGTGFSDAVRADPPAIGSTITFRYEETTDAGVPRFPSFMHIFQVDVPSHPLGDKACHLRTNS